MNLRVHACAVMVASLFLTSRAIAISGTPTWDFSAIAPDPGGNLYISSPELAFDHYGTAAVTWSQADRFDVATNTMNHSSLTPLGIWSHRVMATGVRVGLTSSISYDRAERPHVGWMNGSGTMSLSFNFGSTQNPAMTPTPHTTTPLLTLKHDIAGTFRGMYAGATAGQLGGVTWNGSSYSTSLLATVANVGAVDSLDFTIDHRGLRHAILDGRTQSGSNPAVFLASEPANGATWVSMVLTTADDVGGVDIATNPTTGRVAIAYTVRNASTSRLFYGESTGTSLTPVEVLSTPIELGDISLAFDLTDGQPAIAYEDTSGSQLILAYRSAGGTWSTSLVDDSISISAFDGRRRAPSLAFNDYGTGWPAIAYVDADGSLRLAIDPPGVPEPSTIALLLVAAVLVNRRR